MTTNLITTLDSFKALRFYLVDLLNRRATSFWSTWGKIKFRQYCESLNRREIHLAGVPCVQEQMQVSPSRSLITSLFNVVGLSHHSFHSFTSISFISAVLFSLTVYFNYRTDWSSARVKVVLIRPMLMSTKINGSIRLITIVLES